MHNFDAILKVLIRIKEKEAEIKLQRQITNLSSHAFYTRH